MRAWKIDYFEGFEPEVVTDEFSNVPEILPLPDIPVDTTHYFDRDYWR